MFIADCLSIDKNKELTIGGASVRRLADKYKTPLYIMDEGGIRGAMRAYRDALREHFGENAMACYAGKAFAAVGIYKIATEEGLGADVVSGGELYTAKKAGFPMENVYFHGNNKTDDELKMALEYGVGHIVVDNQEELFRLNDLAGEMSLRPGILFRVKPGIDAHTHEFVKTGKIDSKFGLALENGEALEIVGKAVKLKHVSLEGLHCHIGSQIFEHEPFALAAEVMMEFIAKVRDTYGCPISILNLGGGFGIKYTRSDDPKTPETNIGVAAGAVKAAALKHGLPVPRIVIEPGRSIVGPYGITVYTVGAVKTIENVRTYVSVDGGMTDNPRYALYGSVYEVLSVSRPTEPRGLLCTVAGKCCESGDLIAKDIYTQHIEAGEYLCVLSTGAYNYSMASNYNRIPRPAVVMVRDGADRLVVRRETYEDLIANDVL